MTLTYSFHPSAREEFDHLSLKDQEDFDLAIQALREHPLRGGPGFVVEELAEAPGLWKLKLRHPHRRAYYRVTGNHLRLLGFGPRADFYLRLRDKARLARTRNE